MALDQRVETEMQNTRKVKERIEEYNVRVSSYR